MQGIAPTPIAAEICRFGDAPVLSRPVEHPRTLSGEAGNIEQPTSNLERRRLKIPNVVGGGAANHSPESVRGVLQAQFRTILPARKRSKVDRCSGYFGIFRPFSG